MDLPLSHQKVQKRKSSRVTRQSVAAMATRRKDISKDPPEKLLSRLSQKSLDQKRDKGTTRKSTARSKHSSKTTEQRKRKCSKNITEPKTKIARKSLISIERQTNKRADSKLHATVTQGRKRKRSRNMEEQRGKVPRLSSKEKNIAVKEMKNDKSKSQKNINSTDKRKNEDKQRSNKASVKIFTKTATTKNKSRQISERSISSTGRMKPEINKERNRNADRMHIRLTEKENVESITDPQINVRKPHLKVIKQIKTNLNQLVSNICCVDENTMWIGRQAYDSLMKVKFDQASNLTILKEFKYPKFDFYDFCFDRENNQILYCDRKNNCVMSISSNYQVRKFQCVKPWNPTCITISPDNSIFIGLVHGYSYTEGPHPNEIIKLDENGSVCFRIRSTEKGVRNFLFPHRCTINPVTKDIVVADCRGSEGFIVNFSSKGKMIFTYTDERPDGNYIYTQIRSDAKFLPRGLTCSSKGDILCCNEYNGNIHVLGTSGQLLQIIGAASLGSLGRSWSLSWDMLGHLMIGIMKSGTGMIYIAEYNDGTQEQDT